MFILIKVVRNCDAIMLSKYSLKLQAQRYVELYQQILPI